jgi:hypothetical protein
MYVARRLARFGTPIASFVGLVAVNATLVGCGKKDDAPTLAPSATALASSKAEATAKAWHFVLDRSGATHVDMPGLTEHIVGDTSVADGALDIVPAELSKSRGTVKADLSTFTTHTFGDDRDASQTEHARTWLEAVVHGSVNEPMRWTTFAIRSIDSLSSTDLAKVTPTKDGADEVRTVTMTVHGDMLIHGHQIQKDGVVEVSFRYSGGSPPDAMPTKVTVKSKQPLRVVLKEVDVQPRDPVGQLKAWTAGLVSKVAEFADVTVDLSAAPSQ